MIWNAPTIAGLAAAVALGLVGVGLLWGRHASERLAGVSGRLSEPTRLVLGVCALVVGYHVAAYALPGGWITLHVPASLWWVLAGGVALAIAGSLLGDLVEGRAARDDGEPGAGAEGPDR